MNEQTIKSIKEGMVNMNEWYASDYWTRQYLEEVESLLEDKERMLEQYDCYDYLFTDE